ncbi:MAG: hypothetical protein JWO14_3918 [Solirubrobacterales bacterium]|nr:hypothetical protein [Solirubrobacterales bacterium]
MRVKKFISRGACAAILAVALAAIGMASSASAHTGIWAKFNNCPSTNPEARKCINSVTTTGEVVLGNKTVPIVNPVTIQGGVTKPVERGEEFVEHMIAATNGVDTLSKTPQPVPGGLAGLVNCKEIGNFIVRLGCETVFENGLTGVNATLELAKPASEVEVSESNLAEEFGVAFKLPVKLHLENPFLGGGCYVGSSSSPLIWNLTTGNTNPPTGTAPIHGFGGKLNFLEEEQVAEIVGSELVDNAWAAPSANGCGGAIVDLIIDPIINAEIGLPAAAGKNVSILNNTTFLARAVSVNEH